MKYLKVLLIILNLFYLIHVGSGSSFNPNVFETVKVIGKNSEDIGFFLEKTNEEKQNFLVGIYSPHANVVQLTFGFEMCEKSLSKEVSISGTIFAGEMKFCEVDFLEPYTNIPMTIDFFSDGEKEPLFVRLISVSTK